MKRSKLWLGALMTVTIGISTAFFVNSGLAGKAACALGGDVAAAACARCGDGVCARSCENERTCPRDCAPSGQTK